MYRDGRRCLRGDSQGTEVGFCAQPRKRYLRYLSTAINTRRLHWWVFRTVTMMVSPYGFVRHMSHTFRRTMSRRNMPHEVNSRCRRTAPSWPCRPFKVVQVRRLPTLLFRINVPDADNPFATSLQYLFPAPKHSCRYVSDTSYKRAHTHLITIHSPCQDENQSRAGGFR